MSRPALDSVLAMSPACIAFISATYSDNRATLVPGNTSGSGSAPPPVAARPTAVTGAAGAGPGGIVSAATGGTVIGAVTPDRSANAAANCSGEIRVPIG